MPPGNGLLCALTTHSVSRSVSGPGWKTFALRFCDHCFYFIIMFSSWNHRISFFQILIFKVFQIEYLFISFLFFENLSNGDKFYLFSLGAEKAFGFEKSVSLCDSPSCISFSCLLSISDLIGETGWQVAGDTEGTGQLHLKGGHLV